MELKTSYLIGFVTVGIIVMTFLVLGQEVRKEVREAIQERYEAGKVSEEKYKKALSDGKLSYWESLGLKSN